MRRGTINLFSTEECNGFDASTHTLPLSVFGKYLETEFKFPTDMLLIQPCRTDFLSEISISVKRAVKEITDELLFLLWQKALISALSGSYRQPFNHGDNSGVIQTRTTNLHQRIV